MVYGVRWDRFSSEYFGFSLPLSFHKRPHTHSLICHQLYVISLTHTFIYPKKEAVSPSETLIYSVCFWCTTVSQANGILRSHKCFRSECSYTCPWRRKRHVDSKRRYSALVLHGATKYEAQSEGKRCWFICWQVVLSSVCVLVNVL